MSVVASYTKGPDQSKHGPSWRDVAMIWKELEILVDGPVEVREILASSVGNLPSFQLRAVVRGVHVYSIGQSFVPGGNGGPTTKPAALYLLLTKVYHWYEALPYEQTVIFQQGDAKH